MVKAATAGDSVATVATGVVKAWVIRNDQLFSAFERQASRSAGLRHTHTHIVRMLYIKLPTGIIWNLEN